MYEFTALYVYKIIFMAELLIAEFIMCIGMRKKPGFIIRFAISCTVCIAIAFAIPVIAYNALYCSAMFIVLFAVTLPAIKICYEDNWTSVAFRAIAAYTTQHIAYQFFMVIMFVADFVFADNNFAIGMYGDGSAADFFPLLIYGMNEELFLHSPMLYAFAQLLAYCSYLFIYVLVYALSYKFVAPLLKDSDKFELKNSLLFIFVVCFVIFNVIISSIVTYYGEKNNDFLYILLLTFYNIACCVFTMFLMFEVIFRKQFERDFATANRLLKKSEERYALTKENIQLINMKCHDLKYQIRNLGATAVIDKQALGEMENLISVYDSGIHTGNEALDIIFAEKSLYCNEHGIRLYCIADGARLSFISDSDLYALFGNLLDNAIEAVEGLEEDKRFINLSVKMVNGFPTLSMCNCLARNLTFEDGLPKTTKTDSNLHGYGMKSIRLICRKYDGELMVSVSEGTFNVKIVFMH